MKGLGGGDTGFAQRPLAIWSLFSITCCACLERISCLDCAIFTDVEPALNYVLPLAGYSSLKRVVGCPNTHEMLTISLHSSLWFSRPTTPQSIYVFLFFLAPIKICSADIEPILGSSIEYIFSCRLNASCPAVGAHSVHYTIQYIVVLR